MFAKEDEAQTLEIVLTDRVSGLKAHLLYGVFPHLDVITKSGTPGKVQVQHRLQSKKSNVYGNGL